MVDTNWPRVKELFFTSRELDPATRAAFLDQACGDDRALRDEVESLLESDSTGLPLLDQDLVPAVAAMLAERPEGVAPGRLIGPYRIEREIGRGGMGVVYLAERDDGHYHQQVALKLVSRGLTSASAFWRFSRERQILADLTHPGIARLLDGGVTDGGRPYLVMEHVDGVPIDQHLDAERATIAERLKSFLQVCEAVQHAHSKLVVHCDLKPSNILITAEGEPKLIDFGVARLLVEDHAGESMAEEPITGVGRLTPDYASPQQLRGEPPTVASDVYALGVLLYVLLAGVLPFGGMAGASLAAARVARQRRIEPPSGLTSRGGAEKQAAEVARLRRTTPTALGRRLRGDLDSIVLRALAVRRENRYPSVEQLADDVARHLGHRPIRARRPTAAYRLRKLVRRHRWTVASVLLVVLSLVGGVAVASWQAVRARQAQTVAAHERQRAEGVSDFIEDLFREADPGRVRGRRLTLPEVLDEAAQRIPSDLDEQPWVQIRLLTILGQGYRRMELYARSEEALTRALDLLRGLGETEHPEAARLYDVFGLLWLDRGDLVRARRYLLRARSLRSRWHEERPLDRAESLNSWGLYLRETGRYEAALPFFVQALDLRRAFGAADREMTVSVHNLGESLAQLGQTGRARDLLEEALRSRLARFGPDHFLVGNSHATLGPVLLELGESDRAVWHGREALRVFRTRFGDDHSRVALAHNNLVELIRDPSRSGEADHHLDEAIRIFDRLGDEIGLATALTNRSGLFRLSSG